MEILRQAYDTYVLRRFELEEELKEQQEIRAVAEVDQDFSENQSYEDAVKKIGEINKEYLMIMRLISKAKIVDLNTTSNTISVGTLFNLEVQHPGRLIEDDRKDAKGLKFLYYDKDTDISVFKHDVVFGCPDDSFVGKFIWSTNTVLAEFLMGKTLGTMKYMTPQGVYVKVIASKCEGKTL